MEAELQRFAPAQADCAPQPGRPVHVDIGCGKGESVLHYARLLPQSIQVAIEAYPPGAAALLASVCDEGLANVRIAVADALSILPELIADRSLAQIRVLYPDPWPKMRHRKRRLVNADFLQLARRLLADGGELAFATDWREYHEQVLGLIGCSWRIAAAGPSDEARCGRPVTRYEQRALRDGRTSYDLLLRAEPAAAAAVSVNTPSTPIANKRSACSGELTV